MRASKLRGKTIANVIQCYRSYEDLYGSPGGVGAYTIEAIEFTDGSVMRLWGCEGQGEVYATAVYPGRAVAPEERACSTLRKAGGKAK